MENMNNRKLQALQRVAYSKYQLHWMISHGYSLYDLITQLQGYWEEMEEPIDGPNLMEDIYLPWEEEFGFNGCLWVCFDEFLEAEFLDETYMKELLTTNQFETYMEFRTNKLIG